MDLHCDLGCGAFLNLHGTDMTRDDIINLSMMGERTIKQRIEWAVDMEREECAKICDAAQLFGNTDERWAAKCCSEAIRARVQI